jgi:hypothetical protein
MRLLIRSSLAAVLALAPALAFAAPALDGSAQGVACNATNPTATLTTTQTNDVIIAIAGNENAPLMTLAPSMVVSGGGLSWNKNWALNNNGTHAPNDLLSNVYRSLWYATAPTALTGQTITATLSGSTDASGLVVFGISGANTSTIFDPAGLCETTGTGGSIAPVISGVYSNNAAVFEVVGAITPNLDSVSAAPAGFTDIQYVQQSGCSSKYYYERVSYQVYAAPISNATYTWTGSWGLGGHSVSETPICGLIGSCAGGVRSTCPSVAGGGSGGGGSVLFQTPISYQGERMKVRH